VTDIRIPVRWSPREVPLPARAVIATGAAAKALGRRLVELDTDSLCAVAGDDVLVVFGDALPWIDGVTYLGRDDSAPALLLPTALAPSVPAAVLEAAIRKRIPRAAPVAVLPSPARLVDCGAAREIDRDRLRAWVAS
jgi:hypothetical protein